MAFSVFEVVPLVVGLKSLDVEGLVTVVGECVVLRTVEEFEQPYSSILIHIL